MSKLLEKLRAAARGSPALTLHGAAVRPPLVVVGGLLDLRCSRAGCEPCCVWRQAQRSPCGVVRTNGTRQRHDFRYAHAHLELYLGDATGQALHLRG